MTNVLKAYITYPDMKHNGTGFILDALKSQFKDVKGSTANDGTWIIECDLEIKAIDQLV